MAKVIAVANQKGGVGKTTTVVNLSSCVASLGKRVLVVDLDPQGNTTSGYGVAKHTLPASVYECLIGEADIREAITKTNYNADLVASNTQLAGAVIELVQLPRRENRLRMALAPITNLYDYIFIDCPPSLDLLTLNGLCACDTVLIPIQCEYYALEGLSELMNTLKMVRKKYNSYLDIEGVVFTMYNGRFNLTIQVVDQVKKYYGNKVYKTVIPRTVRLSEAPSFGMPINFYEPNGRGSEAYMSMAREFLQNNEH
ncbi:MAG: ParA family protein [Gemmiger sp.]